MLDQHIPHHETLEGFLFAGARALHSDALVNVRVFVFVVVVSTIHGETLRRQSETGVSITVQSGGFGLGVRQQRELRS